MRLDTFDRPVFSGMCVAAMTKSWDWVGPGTNINDANNVMTFPLPNGTMQEITVRGGEILQRRVCKFSGIRTNFNDQDLLIYSKATNTDTPLSLLFNPPVKAIGAQMSIAFNGGGSADFQAWMCVFLPDRTSADHLHRPAISTMVLDNSAIFLGAIADQNESIKEVQFISTQAEPAMLGFAINHITFDPA